MATAVWGAQLRADPHQLQNDNMNSSHHTFRTNASQPRDAAASALQEQLLAREHRMESQRTRKKAAAAAQRAATAAGGGGCCSAVLEAASRHEDVSVGAVCTSCDLAPASVPMQQQGERGGKRVLSSCAGERLATDLWEAASARLDCIGEHLVP